MRESFSIKIYKKAINQGRSINNCNMEKLHAKIGKLTVKKDFLQDVYEKLGRN